MLYIKQNEFYLSSKQTYWNLLRDAALEKEVDVLQEVKGSKPCKGGEILCFFVSSVITKVVKLNDFKICGEKQTIYRRLSFIVCQFFLDPGIYIP